MASKYPGKTSKRVWVIFGMSEKTRYRLAHTRVFRNFRAASTSNAFVLGCLGAMFEFRRRVNLDSGAS